MSLILWLFHHKIRLVKKSNLYVVLCLLYILSQQQQQQLEEYKSV